MLENTDKNYVLCLEDLVENFEKEKFFGYSK